MKATGRTRPVDGLGRVVIPKEIRKSFDIVDNQDALEIFTDGNYIILKKYEPACTFCGDDTGVIRYKDKNVCAKCVAELSKFR